MDRFVTACETIVEKKGVRLDDFGRIQYQEMTRNGQYSLYRQARARHVLVSHPHAAEVKKERSADLRSGAE